MKLMQKQWFEYGKENIASLMKICHCVTTQIQNIALKRAMSKCSTLFSSLCFCQHISIDHVAISIQYSPHSKVYPLKDVIYIIG